MSNNISSNKAYKQIAPFYDKSTNLKIFNTYKSIIGDVKNKRMLDLGCGTGTLLKHYSATNETYGIDSSPEMIKIAKTKDKKSNYSIGDIIKIQFKRKFDIITCTYDTVNHLPSLDDWKLLFKAVSKHLSERGIFVFDYNTVFGLTNNAGTELQKIGKNFIVRQVITTKQSCLWNFHNFIKEPSGLFKYQKSVIEEKSYPDKIIEKEIRQNFKDVEIIKNNNFRTYVKAKKKAT